MTLPPPPKPPRRINIRNPQWKGIAYVYIGRPAGGIGSMHFGNPFSHKQGTLATVVVASQEMAVREFEKWLRGTSWKRLDQKRRMWILDHLDRLDNQVIGCFCAERERWCHGEVLLRLRAEQLAAVPKKESSSRRKPEARQLSLFPKGTIAEIKKEKSHDE